MIPSIEIWTPINVYMFGGITIADSRMMPVLERGKNAQPCAAPLDLIGNSPS
jgi:hypothetical protein